MLGDFPIQLPFFLEKSEAAHIVRESICCIPHNEFLVRNITIELHIAQSFLEALDLVGDYTDLDTAYREVIVFINEVKTILSRAWAYEKHKIQGIRTFIRS